MTGGATKKPSGKKLVLAAKNKANCAGKGTPVKSLNACKSAAKAMKKSFYTKPLNSISYPAGCFFMSNRFYYNTRKGKGNTRAQPVCVQVTGGKKTTPKKKPTKPQGGKKTTKKPTKKLVFAGSGKTNCAGKGTPVKNAQGCAAAAKAMKRAYGGSSATKFTQFPKGCFGYKGKFSYNAGKTGKGKAGASPVCVMTGGATKKPSGKKLVMAAKGKANCAGKGTPVKSLNACKSAAKAMKKSFYPKTLTSTGYPKGCFFMSNRFY